MMLFGIQCINHDEIDTFVELIIISPNKEIGYINLDYVLKNYIIRLSVQYEIVDNKTFEKFLVISLIVNTYK